MGRLLKMDANSPILDSMCETLVFIAAISDLNCCVIDSISACKVERNDTSMSLRVVSMTG